jgi:hypothetical protein
MHSKPFVFLVVMGLAGACPVNAQSPTPTASASPAKHSKKKAAAATEASPAASASPATAEASPSPAKKSRKKAAATTKSEAATGATPAAGGGHGLVWVNTETHVYHKEGSRFYGKTQKGKYVSEADAIKEGDRAAKNE